jgi:DNA mismatch repair ATPase MutS
MDTSTGELFTQASTLAKRALQEDVARISPSEVVLPHSMSEEKNQSHPLLRALRELDNPPAISYPHQPVIKPDSSLEKEGRSASPSAIPLLSSYINETLLEQRPDLTHPLRVSANNNMRVDRVSLRALEVLHNNDGGVSGTLLSVMDRTVTSAGRRLLSDRLAAPSKSVSEIESRLSLVDSLKHDRRLRDQVVELLKQLDDEARLLQKMSIGRPTPEDLLVMARAIRTQGQIKALLEETVLRTRLTVSPTQGADLAVLGALAADMRNFDHLAEKIEASVDSKALEAQRTRDFAAELAASQTTTEDVEQAEDEGIDVWNIPLEVLHGKAAKSKQLKADDLVLDIPALKAGVPPISWGKGENSVLHPRFVRALSQIGNILAYHVVC